MFKSRSISKKLEVRILWELGVAILERTIILCKMFDRNEAKECPRTWQVKMMHVEFVSLGDS